MENKTRINKIEVTTKIELDKLYSKSAFTIEGFDTSEENFKSLIDWFNEYGGVSDPLKIFVIKGSTMNKEYGLTEDNAYPNDLNIICIELKDIKELNKIIMPRFQIQGRWFDDVVDNNEYRQNKIDGIEENEDEEEF